MLPCLSKASTYSFDDVNLHMWSVVLTCDLEKEREVVGENPSWRGMLVVLVEPCHIMRNQVQVLLFIRHSLAKRHLTAQNSPIPPNTK